jgi:hypothetical protein
MEFVPVGATEGKASKTVLERAQKASAAMVRDLKHHGFSLGAYKLPAWVSGDLPTISAAEFPSQIEQFQHHRNYHRRRWQRGASETRYKKRHSIC